MGTGEFNAWVNLAMAHRNRDKLQPDRPFSCRLYLLTPIPTLNPQIVGANLTKNKIVFSSLAHTAQALVHTEGIYWIIFSKRICPQVHIYI